ncbi:MAG TPA: hypothetical protein PLR57_04510, partial [Clostridia bacterium]|nr:hypothetical protein [Clostridia bacterium]
LPLALFWRNNTSCGSLVAVFPAGIVTFFAALRSNFLKSGWSWQTDVQKRTAKPQYSAASAVFTF